MAALHWPRLPLFLITTLCLSGVARAQSGGPVRMSGDVSRIVTLSSPIGVSVFVEGVRATSRQNPDRSLTITLYGTTYDPTQFDIPVQIRSNTAFRLFAVANAGGSDLSSLSVVEARPTGNLVAADIVEALSVARIFDARPRAGKLISSGDFSRLKFSAPSELLSGPRVSLGGTLTSPQNALEIKLSVAVEPRPADQLWIIELQLSAMPAARL